MSMTILWYVAKMLFDILVFSALVLQHNIISHRNFTSKMFLLKGVTGIQGKRERNTGTGTCKIVHSFDSSPVRFTEL